MRKTTLRQSLFFSYIQVGLIPIGFMAVFILLFIFRYSREDFQTRLHLTSEGIRGQIQLFMDQPRNSLNTIAHMLSGLKPFNSETTTTILNASIRDALYFESIYLLNPEGDVINLGLPLDQEQRRQDLLGINFGHKTEFRQARSSRQPQWSDTFLSLASGKISLTLYVPAGEHVLAADINLNTLTQFINRLGDGAIITMIIDRNGAIIFHPEPDLVGKSIMVNTIDLVTKALAGTETIGQFTFMDNQYFGSTNIIGSIGWVILIAEPTDRFTSFLIIPLVIIGSGICVTVLLSLILAYYLSRRLSGPLMEITVKSTVLASGNYTHPLPASAFCELQQLTDSINHMASAIQKREEELRDNELKYRELVENTNNLVMRLDADGLISYANHAIFNLTGIAAADAVGTPFKECLVPEDCPLVQLSLDAWTADCRESATVECRMANCNGSRSFMLLSFNLHYDTLAALTDINIIGHDITIRNEVEQQKRKMEEKQQQSHKMELLGMMAGGVAHDLNNILAGIINYPELLLLKLEPDSPLRAPLGAIKKSGERAAAVVADLLTLARGAAAVHKLVDLNTLLNDYFAAAEFRQLQASRPDIVFTFNPSPGLWTCSCSPVHIEKTFMNLVLNSFEAIKNEGWVKVTTTNIPADDIAGLAETLPPGPYVAFSIQDSGSGISPEDQQRIFEPFYSKKSLGRSGTGIGLTVAWNTIQEHGGTITVTSSQLGTTFTVLLPAQADQCFPIPLADKTDMLRGKREHILIVDDEESLREIAATMLNHLGYQTSTVGSGEEALQFMEKTPVDLVLLDMLMDPGMNGRQTYARIKQQFPSQKALIATGYSASDDVEATLREGAGGFIKKPYSLHTLGQAVLNVLQDH